MSFESAQMQNSLLAHTSFVKFSAKTNRPPSQTLQEGVTYLRMENNKPVLQKAFPQFAGCVRSLDLLEPFPQVAMRKNLTFRPFPTELSTSLANTPV